MEGVERNTYGKNDFQQKAIRGDVEYLRKLRDEEVVVLEQCEDAEVQDDIERCPSLCLILCFRFSDEQSATPRTERGKRNKQQKPPVPPAVEHITRHHNESVLHPQLILRLADEAVENKPIEKEDYRQKDGELDGVEKHGIMTYLENAKIRKIEMEKLNYNSCSFFYFSSPKEFRL